MTPTRCTGRYLLAALICAGLTAWLILTANQDPEQDSISRHSLARIEFGMTKEQVEEILGQPGVPTDPLDVPDVYRGRYSTALAWHGQKGTISVFFNDRKLISGISTTLPKEDNHSFVSRIFRWMAF